MSGSSEFALELRDVRKSFGKTEIIRGASLQVRPGERVAVIGPNGAGKSTLFNLVSGRFGSTSGDILLQGRKIDGLKPYEINRLGLVFTFMVMYAPGGISSLIMMNLRVAAFGKLRPLLASYLALAGTGFVILAGSGAMIEMLYHLQLNQALGPELKFMGASLNAKDLDSWFGAAFVLAIGVALFEMTRRQFVREWGETQEWIEKEIKRREAAL